MTEFSAPTRALDVGLAQGAVGEQHDPGIGVRAKFAGSSTPRSPATGRCSTSANPTCSASSASSATDQHLPGVECISSTEYSATGSGPRLSASTWVSWSSSRPPGGSAAKDAALGTGSGESLGSFGQSHRASRREPGSRPIEHQQLAAQPFNPVPCLRAGVVETAATVRARRKRKGDDDNDEHHREQHHRGHQHSGHRLDGTRETAVAVGPRVSVTPGGGRERGAGSRLEPPVPLRREAPTEQLLT